MHSKAVSVLLTYKLQGDEMLPYLFSPTQHAKAPTRTSEFEQNKFGSITRETRTLPENSPPSNVDRGENPSALRIWQE